MNVLLIEKAPALEESDVELARDFITALGEFIRLLRPLPGESADRLRDEIASTAARPQMTGDLETMQESYSRMSGYNELLTRRYREVVFGEPPDLCASAFRHRQAPTRPVGTRRPGADG